MVKKKIDAMRAEYGSAAGFCRDCRNFVSVRYHDRILRKCAAYGITHSEASDWAGKWLACGLYGVDFDTLGRKPLIETLRAKKELEVSEGQVSLLL